MFFNLLPFIRTFWPRGSILLVFLLIFALNACAPTPPKGDLQASRIDQTTLPKFGVDPHWGSLTIPENITAMRENIMVKITENQANPEEFSLDITQTGWQALSQGDYELAMRRFNQAWLVVPESPYAIMGMAMVVFDRDGDIRGGLLLMQSLEQPLENDASYWVNLASMERRADMPVEALAHFEKAYPLSPNNPIVIQNLTELYSQVGDFTAACTVLGRARLLSVSIDRQKAQYIEANAQQSCDGS